MKSNGLWKQQWKSVVRASSVKATGQQQALLSDGELQLLDAFSYLHPDITTCLPETSVFIRKTKD